MRKKGSHTFLSCLLLACVIQTKGQDHPVLDQVANKVIQK
jgi:hypothetical protein